MKLTLKKARLCAEKTQRDVAKHLGINVDTYRALERDPEKATIYQAKSLSAYFGIPYDEIFFCNSSTLSSEAVSKVTLNNSYCNCCCFNFGIYFWRKSAKG